MIKRDRIYYMDYLRAFIILIVITLHSLLPFVMGYEWFINDKVKTYPFTAASVIMDTFIMALMFFIAGYFALPSIRKGTGPFVQGKISRILIPFFIGTIFLSPIMSYLSLSYYKAVSVSFSEYWSSTWLKGFMNPAHFWFLFILFSFFMVFTLVYSIWKEKIEKIYEASKEKPMGIIGASAITLIFITFAIILFYLAGRKFPDGSWFRSLKFVSIQLTRFTAYIFYFAAGVIFQMRRVRFNEAFLKFTPLFIFAAVGATFFYNAFKFLVYWSPTGGFMQPKIQFYNAIVHILYCFFMSLTLLMAFRRYLNFYSKTLKRIADNSYTVYFVHMIFTVAIQYNTATMDISLFQKFLINAFGTIFLSYITSELITKVLYTFKTSKNSRKALVKE